jgi:hypothetical protein
MESVCVSMNVLSSLTACVHLFFISRFTLKSGGGKQT